VPYIVSFRAKSGLAGPLVVSELKSESILVLKFIIIYPPCTRQTIPIVTSPPLFAAQMHANAHNSLRFLIIIAIYIPKGLLDVSGCGRYLHEPSVCVGHGGVLAAHEGGRLPLRSEKWPEKPPVCLEELRIKDENEACSLSSKRKTAVWSS
jgi:hypothetical protein